MGGQQAAEVLSLVKYRGKGDPEEVSAFKSNIQKNYEKQGSAYYSTSRLWDDGIVKPSDLRRVLGLSVGVTLNAPIEETKHGVFRM
jgi:3-methylcrotonyl-CoA carboxylase beta subunit